MKKVLAAAFIASLLMINCSKKTDHSLQDSNTMLEEPEVPTVTDSTAKKQTHRLPQLLHLQQRLLTLPKKILQQPNNEKTVFNRMHRATDGILF